MSLRERHIIGGSQLAPSYAVDESAAAHRRALQMMARQKHRNNVRLRIQRARRRMR